MNSMQAIEHCGYVAIVGRPNVGKSTLLNRIVRQKISITSSKPQTTRHRILGIKTGVRSQVVYVDTPGLHPPGKGVMNRLMNRAAKAVLGDVDVVLFVIEALRWTEEDQYILRALAKVSAPVVLALNKVDKVKDKERLLPQLEMLGAQREFAEIVPIAARTGKNVASLEECVTRLLPAAPALFPADQVTDRSERFIAAELIREKLTRRLGQELPYALTVEIEAYREKDAIIEISAVVWVERAAQKAIVIGREGRLLKLVGQQAREEMERMLGRKVFLHLWVKVKERWSDDERALRGMGYGE